MLFAETLQNPVLHSTSEHRYTYVSVSASINNQYLLRFRELLVRVQSYQLIINKERTSSCSPWQTKSYLMSSDTRLILRRWIKAIITNAQFVRSAHGVLAVLNFKVCFAECTKSDVR